MTRKRKSLEEASRAKETCPIFYDESIIVAEQLEASKSENAALMKGMLQLQETIMHLQDSKNHLQLERSTVFRDSCILYKRGIIELQLSVFINNHENTYDEFYCDNTAFRKTFSAAMHHWRSCKHHKVKILENYREDKLNLKLFAPEKEVNDSLDYLYETLSGMIHFKAGEEFPIKIVPFGRDADTLAFITFLHHYDIPMFLVSTPPIKALNSTNVKDEKQALDSDIGVEKDQDNL